MPPLAMVIAVVFLVATLSLTNCSSADEGSIVLCASNDGGIECQQQNVTDTFNRINDLPHHLNLQGDVSKLSVYFTDEYYSLNTILKMALKAKEVIFEGFQPGKSIINCSRNKAGMKFINKGNKKLTVRNLKFCNCGGSKNFTDHAPGALYFSKINYTLINVEVVGSTNKAILSYESETQVIQNCTFFNNSAHVEISIATADIKITKTNFFKWVYLWQRTVHPFL